MFKRNKYLTGLVSLMKIIILIIVVLSHLRKLHDFVLTFNLKGEAVRVFENKAFNEENAST